VKACFRSASAPPKSAMILQQGSHPLESNVLGLRASNLGMGLAYGRAVVLTTSRHVGLQIAGSGRAWAIRLRPAVNEHLSDRFPADAGLTDDLPNGNLIFQNSATYLRPLNSVTVHGTAPPLDCRLPPP
jgi:hypothetical protein